MAARHQVKAGLRFLRRTLADPISATWYRGLAKSRFAPGFSGAHPDVKSALASIKPGRKRGYNHPELAEVSFKRMCQLQLWDYPVLYWLNQLKRPGLRLLDAGGHLGTRYIAFGQHIDLSDIHWVIQDLPAIIAEAKQRQKAGELPAAIRYEADLAQAGPADVLLASGLFQYIDSGFHDLVAKLANRPQYVLLNKVATRDGPSVTTLERIGPSMVPYQMRNREAFEADIQGAGYQIRDSWEIKPLSHVIPTHPHLGASTSRGYLLENVE